MKIRYQRPLISVQDAVSFIDKGEKYIRTELWNLSEDEQFDILNGIVLSPDYQRQYRYTPKEETSIIESLLLDIPIPEIFLVRASKGIQIRHVMDGQHRLSAIFRYVKDRFALRNLELLGDDERYVNRKFSELDREAKIKILGSHLSILEFEPFEDDALEIELFKRYNRNTKPLERHEIAMATYFSNTSQFISKFINRTFENRNSDYISDKLTKIYNITDDRREKQKNHQEICIILSILESGPDIGAKDGLEASTNFLKKKAKLFKNNEDEHLDSLKEKFDEFNKFVLEVSNKTEHPFSTSLYKDSEKRIAKYHVGISMILAIVFHSFDVNIYNSNLVADLNKIIILSPLGDVEYNASSTNTRNIMNYLDERNNIFGMTFESLTIKH